MASLPLSFLLAPRLNLSGDEVEGASNCGKHTALVWPMHERAFVVRQQRDSIAGNL
jgi:hypothetical protein